MKVSYISEWHIDLDITVIKELSRVCELHWFLIVTYDCPYDVNFIKEYVKDTNCVLHIMIIEKRRRSPWFFYIYYLFLKKSKKLKVDIIYSSIYSPYFLLVYKMLHVKIPTVKALHDVKLHSNTQYNKFAVLGWRANVKMHDKFLLFSENQKKIFDRLYPNKTAYVVGMSIKDFGPIHPPIPLGDPIKFLFFGTLELYKGYDLLIMAYEKMLESEKSKAVTLSILGKASSEAKKKCDEYIEHIGNYNICNDFIPNDEVPIIFSSHHFLVLPYRDATQSGPLMIGIFYEIPIIAPRIACFEEILSDGIDGILYDNDDKNGLYNALKKARGMSPEKYNNLRMNVQKLKKRYSEYNIAQNYINAFTDIIQKLNS